MLRATTNDIVVRINKDSLLGVKKPNNMPFNDLLCILDELVSKLFQQTSFSCIDLEKIGIKCLGENDDPKCVLLNWLIDHTLTNEESITTLQQTLETIQIALGNLADEKVKVIASGSAGYLYDLIITPPGTKSVDNGLLVLSGFVPIGFCGIINPNRLVDFDASGKGKVNTDCFGWALRNGNNGTKNVIGALVRYETDPALVGTIDGTDNIVISIANINTFSLPVTGLIGDSLENGVQFTFPATNNKNGGPRPNGFASNHSGGEESYKTDPYNFKHSHTFQLNASHTNPNPEPVWILPKHIKEIPIERIF